MEAKNAKARMYAMRESKYHSYNTTALEYRFHEVEPSKNADEIKNEYLCKKLMRERTKALECYKNAVGGYFATL